MKNSLLILAGAAALSLASCSQEKTTEVTTAPADGTMTTTTTTTSMAPMTDAQIEARAQQIADKMVANMKITDEATKTKIRTAYQNRYKRMNEMRSKYATDTTGMAAAMRDERNAEDQEFKVIFVEPAQYQAYQSSRADYDDSNYSTDASMSSMSDTASSSMAPTSSTMTTEETTTTTTTDNGMSGGMDANVSKMKAKADDGSKIKVKDNGKVKIKDAEGNKSKN
jgi:hypothetical protein